MQKKGKFRGFWIIIALAFTTLPLTGCPPDPNSKCECTDKVHPYGSPCTCPVSGTSACDCTEEQPAHTYAATWSSDTTQHWKECTANDGAKTDVAAHTASDWKVDQAATATTAGSQHKECTVCGYELETETIPVTHTHDWSEWQETAAPTTTAEGIATKTCATCGATETRPIDKLPACTCPADTTHEPNEPCCNGTDCTCPIAEPAIKEFQNIYLFERNYSAPELFITYTANIQDDRIACGSASLQELGIINIIQQEIGEAYNGGNVGVKTRFSNVFGVFGLATDGVTIIVNNSATQYKLNAPDQSTIYFHIDYLQSNPMDIQQIIRGAVNAMNFGEELPYYVSWDSCTVTFDYDYFSGGANRTAIQILNKGEKAIKPADPTRNGFVFDYWYNIATNTEWDFNTTITANITLKAKWLLE